MILITQMSAFPGIKKVIVYYANNQVHAVPCEDDLDEGQMVWMHKED